MKKEEFIQAINNCKTMTDILKCEGLFYDEVLRFKWYDRLEIEIHIAKIKDKILTNQK